VIYSGMITEHPHALTFDKHHWIEAGKVFPVCGNTFRMLAESRLPPTSASSAIQPPLRPVRGMRHGHPLQCCFRWISGIARNRSPIGSRRILLLNPGRVPPHLPHLGPPEKRQIHCSAMDASSFLG
jgi:hypothetical protein